MSPAPQERFSHLPAQHHYPLPTYNSSDYQLPPRANDFYLQNDAKPIPSDTKFMQELVARIEKLELRSERVERVEGRLERVEGGMGKIEGRMDLM
jgi:hypothetical protein